MEADPNGETSLEGKFSSVAHQVEEDLLESLDVCEHLSGYIRRYLQVEGETLGTKLEAHDVADLLDRSPHVRHFLIDGELIVLEATHVQGVLNHVLKMVRRVQDYPKIVFSPRC